MKSPLVDIERLAINLTAEDRAKLVVFLLDSLESVAFGAEQTRNIDRRVLAASRAASTQSAEESFLEARRLLG